ncbi:MAG: hypothetical protein C4542_09525 [Dehalococcoidia bacterium]|nr:MAG: hypothetical protein C4542_09525 [Dehalococcoidia bacterium]
MGRQVLVGYTSAGIPTLVQVDANGRVVITADDANPVPIVATDAGTRVEVGDQANNALRVNVVAGGAGGGIAQTQVRDAAGAWTPVGYFAGDLNMPVQGAVDQGSPAAAANAWPIAASTGAAIVQVGDAVNNAVRVNVVAGGAGGGVAQTQVQNGAGAWTAVGYAGGNLNMPIQGTVDQGAPAAAANAWPVRVTDGLGNIIAVGDLANTAVRVNVVAGGAGGGAAQTQVQNGAGAWTAVGYAAGNLNMPVEVAASLPAGANTIGNVGITDFLGDEADLDSLGGGDTHGIVALGVAGVGGHVIITGDAANGLDVDVTRVSGNVTVVQATHDNLNLNANLQVGNADVGVGNPVPVSDNGGSLTVDNAALSVVGGGAEATALRVTIANDSTGLLSVDDNGGSLTVDAPVGTPVAVRLSDGVAFITFAELDLDSGAGTVNRVSVGLAVPGAGGPVAITGDAANGLDVDVTRVSGDVTIVQATAANLNAQVVGAVAHDAVDAGNPIKIGAKAVSSLEAVTLVASGDRTDGYADLDGAILVRQSAALGDLVSERVTNADGVATAFTNFAAVAGVKNYVRGYSVYNSSATPGYLDFRDGAAGAVLWTVPLPANSGANIVSDEPLFKTSANTALAYDVSAALDTVYISVTGFQSKVA